MPGMIQTYRMFDFHEMKSTAGFTSHMEIVTPGLITTLCLILELHEVKTIVTFNSHFEILIPGMIDTYRIFDVREMKSTADY